MRLTTNIKGRLIAPAALVPVAASAFAGFSCMIDNSPMMPTGQTRAEMGKLLYEHKCINGQIGWTLNLD